METPTAPQSDTWYTNALVASFDEGCLRVAIVGRVDTRRHARVVSSSPRPSLNHIWQLSHATHVSPARVCSFSPLFLTLRNTWGRKQNKNATTIRTHAYTTSIKVRLLQSLDHPNIIRYLDFFLEERDEEQKQLVIVFEW